MKDLGSRPNSTPTVTKLVMNEPLCSSPQLQMRGENNDSHLMDCGLGVEVRDDAFKAHVPRPSPH